MRTVLSFLRSRATLLLGMGVLSLSQAGCAHTVWMEPSVVVQARVGGPVYGPVYGPAPVVVAPAPVWMAPAPPVVMVPRVVMPQPVYRSGAWGERREHGHGHGHGHGHWGWR